jgi:hypothetical protein
VDWMAIGGSTLYWAGLCGCVPLRMIKSKLLFRVGG